MRFKKGTKVEVLTQKEVPSGSWRCAEIIGGNGHSYTVRYDGDMGSFGKEIVEKVSRKSIRPRPPPVDVLGDWMAGDVVEVFHNFSWKMATVLKGSGPSYLWVRLLGSAIEFKAMKVDVRARLCWQNGKWIVIAKASNKCEDLKFRLPSTQNDDNHQKLGTNVSRCVKDDRIPSTNINHTLETHAIPSGTLKRKSSEHSLIEAHAGRNRKQRLREKQVMWRQFNVMQQPLLPEKVDNVACSREMLGENCMHPCFTNKITGCSELIMESERTGGAVGCSRSLSLESNDDNSVSSSVGSCSVNGNYSHNLHHVFAGHPFGDNDSQSSDAESFCQLRPEEGPFVLPTHEELMDGIHRLELHAYRCTIEALHASGPLSWEQEMLLTNLRDSLHISNDEHLMEIRNLVSSSACIRSR